MMSAAMTPTYNQAVFYKRGLKPGETYTDVSSTSELKVCTKIDVSSAHFT